MFTDYGVFTKYDHNTRPGHILTGIRTLCIENEAGADFYDLRNGIMNNPTHPERTWLSVFPDTGLIAVATHDVDLQFPQDRRLIAIDPVPDPTVLAGQIFNFEDGTITPAPPPPPLAFMTAVRMVASAMLTVDSEGGVAGIETSIGVSMAMEMDVGQMLVGWNAPLVQGYIPSTPTSGKAGVRLDVEIDDMQPEYMIMSFYDRATGERVRPDWTAFTVTGQTQVP
jgi:hypothetical protein